MQGQSLSRHLSSPAGCTDKGAVTRVEIWCFKERGREKERKKDAIPHTSCLLLLLLLYPPFSSPLATAEEGAGRAFGYAEFARAGRVRALCDERLQIRDAYLLLCLGLRGKVGKQEQGQWRLWVVRVMNELLHLQVVIWSFTDPNHLQMFGIDIHDLHRDSSPSFLLHLFIF